jgi:hypothetical protein
MRFDLAAFEQRRTVVTKEQFGTVASKLGTCRSTALVSEAGLAVADG